MTLTEIVQFSLDNVVFIILTLILLCFYFKRNIIRNIITVEDGFTTCKNAGCVRCNKYKVTLETAMKKLKAISNRELAAEIENCIVETPNRIKYLDQKPNVFFYQCLSSVPVWDKSVYEDTTLLEQANLTILEEYLNLPAKNLGGWTSNTAVSGSWDVFYLINQGSVVEENVRRCPGTMAVINCLPRAMRNNVFSNVMFSVINPQTIITEHYGPTNIRLRCHLGLVTPTECTLTVADQTVTWEEGRCIVFDDSFLHCVENAGRVGEEGVSELLTRSRPQPTSSNIRAVLIVDLWHPDLTDEEQSGINTAFSPQ